VANPNGGKSEYLIGRQYGLVASVNEGRIILTSSERRGDVDMARDPVGDLSDLKPNARDGCWLQ
jgi:hypothetical protein